MIQALWKDDDHYLQLPHMTEQKIKTLKGKLKGMPLEFFCRLGADKRKELEIHETAKEYQDME